MRPIVVRDSRVPKLFSWFFPVAAITLWPFIFIKKGYDNERLINHEAIHIRQYNELLVIGFALLYIYDWVVGLVRYRSFYVAYHFIRFEQEAREFGDDQTYLTRRKPYAWKAFDV